MPLHCSVQLMAHLYVLYTIEKKITHRLTKWKVCKISFWKKNCPFCRHLKFRAPSLDSLNSPRTKNFEAIVQQLSEDAAFRITTPSIEPRYSMWHMYGRNSPRQFFFPVLTLENYVVPQGVIPNRLEHFQGTVISTLRNRPTERAMNISRPFKCLQLKLGPKNWDDRSALIH